MGAGPLGTGSQHHCGPCKENTDEGCFLSQVGRVPGAWGVGAALLLHDVPSSPPAHTVGWAQGSLGGASCTTLAGRQRRCPLALVWECSLGEEGFVRGLKQNVRLPTSPVCGLWGPGSACGPDGTAGDLMSSGLPPRKLCPLGTLSSPRGTPASGVRSVRSSGRPTG